MARSDRVYRQVVQTMFGEDAPTPDRGFVQRALARGYVTQDRLEECLVEAGRLEDAESPERVGMLLLIRGHLSLDQYLDLMGDPEEPPSIGRIGKYRLTREIARGGMGVVYEAEDPHLRRRVALKVLPLEHETPNAVRRLRREAAIAGRLRHPNIVGIHEVGRARSSSGVLTHFMTMDLVEGRTLAELMESRKTGRAELLRILEDVARAVGYAHSRQVVHRDLKPANVIVESGGRAVLGDFGLARADAFRSRLTGTHAVMGTPMYMAPEQIDGRTGAVDARSDVYALGAILYEILTGRTPFSAASLSESYFHILDGDPPRPSRVKAGVERDLEIVCLKAMEKSQDRRYANGTQFADDLARFRRGEPIRARKSAWLHCARRALARRKWVWGAVAATTALLLVAYAVPNWVREGRDRRRAEERLRFQKEGEIARLRARERARPYLEEGRRLVERMRLRLKDPDYAAEELLDLRRQAEERCSRALVECDDLPEALLVMARASMIVGDESRALRWLDGAILLSPVFSTAYLERARLMSQEFVTFAHGREMPEKRSSRIRSKIESDLGVVARCASDLAERRYGEALMSFGRGEFDRAQEILKDYLKDASEDGYAHQIRACALYHLRRCADAEKEATLTLKCDARHVPALTLRSFVRIELARYDAAIADSSRALAIRPSYARAYLARGNAYRGKGERDKSLSDYDQALDLQPDYAPLYVARSMARLEQGNSAGAIEDCTAAIKLRPKNGFAYVTRADALRVRGDWKAGIADCEIALGLDPNDWNAYLVRGRILHEMRDSKGAGEDYDRAIALHPTSVTAHYNRANLYLEAGDLDRAMTGYGRALELDPKFAKAHVNRAVVEIRRGAFRAAERNCTAAILLDPNLPEAYANRAEARQGIGDFAGAEDDRREAEHARRTP